MLNIANVALQIAIILNITFSYRTDYKVYPHKRIERKWQRFWLDNKTFEIPSDKNITIESKPKYYCLGMIPYPSGSGLHMGHMLGYTGLDIVARYKRMCGYEVLNPIGWDSFGIPAERYAEEVNRPVQEVVDENINNFKRQLLLMGYSYDWSKTITTSDPSYYKWTQWTFLQMYKKALVERAFCLANYCPKLGTVLSNEEIINGLSERGGFEVYRKKIPHWTIKITKYCDWLNDNLEHLQDWPEKVINAQRNWIGKLVGYLIPFDTASCDIKLRAFITDPLELIRCNRIDVSADFDALSKLVTPKQSQQVYKLADKCKRLSNIQRMRLGEIVHTGMFAINPITKANIPVYVNPTILSDVSNNNADMENCRIHTNDQLTNEIDGNAAKNGEIYANDFIKHTKFLMRDWIFSRQRNWGEPIPLINCNGQYQPVDKLPYIEPKPTETMPQWAGSSFHFVRFIDPTNQYCLVSKELANKWLPVDLYIGGSEHAISHLLYSRFWYKFLHDINMVPNDVPFKKVCLHGMLHERKYIHIVNGKEIEVCNNEVIHYKDKFYLKNVEGGIDFKTSVIAKCAKMSKSKGNIVSPDHLIEQYGTDVLRLHLMFLGPFDRDKIWKLEGISGMQRLITRVYNLIVWNGTKLNHKIVDIVPNKCYKMETNKLIHGVTKDIENLKFNKSPALFSSYMNFISRYTSGKIRDEVTLHDFTLIPLKCVKILVKLLNPFCPHLAEELWQIINLHSTSSSGANQSTIKSIKSLCYEEWPTEMI